jgi:hypothetical protein
MNVFVSNGTAAVNGKELRIIDMDSTIVCDEKTSENVRNRLVLETPKSACWAMIANCYSTFCAIDKADCNGDFTKCHMLEKAVKAAGWGGAV